MDMWYIFLIFRCYFKGDTLSFSGAESSDKAITRDLMPGLGSGYYNRAIAGS
jgi:hypothetical protein